jgi:tetraacyldisaccharide 4'-kinase
MKGLRPLVPLYAAALAAKNTAYAQHWITPKRLEAPVISVGNLSVGGAGKTPLVISLAQLLAGRGFAVDVLSRGYGRRSSAIEQVQVGLARGAERFGDEPMLIAQASGVPVYVGASRCATGRLAEQRPATGPRVHLLDDGFQHRRLARAVDIVVLHASDFAGKLLPAGRLREPLASLRRASIAVLRVEDAGYAARLRTQFPALLIWQVARAIEFAPSAEPAVAFCGIAHPGEFFGSLTRVGAALTATHAFRDHHRWTDADISTLLTSILATGARRLLTTEKDLIRMSAAHRDRLSQAAELSAVPLRARLVDEEAALDRLLALAAMRKSEIA